MWVYVCGGVWGLVHGYECVCKYVVVWVRVCVTFCMGMSVWECMCSGYQCACVGCVGVCGCDCVWGYGCVCGGMCVIVCMYACIH